MIKLLINNISHVHPDPVKDQRGAYKRGFPVVIYKASYVWSNGEQLPKFVRVEISDASVADVQHYIRPWERTLALSIDSSDLTTDTHTVTVTADTGVNVSGLGAITKAQVDGFLTRWGATVTGFSQNSVTFDAVIWDAIRSRSFWGRSAATLAQIVFVEVSYDSGTGAHQVTADYSALPLGNHTAQQRATAVQRNVEKRGGSVVSNTAGVIEFVILRSDVRAQFLADIKERDEHQSVSRRSWVVPTASMDAIVSAGGTVTRTLAQVQAAIHDRMTD